MAEFASPYFKEAGLENKIKMITGDAASVVEALSGPFDLVFIDADKENYIKYFDLVFPKVTAGGFILADNTLWYGRVMDKDAETDRETAGIVGFNNYIQQFEGIENVLLPVRDGITLMRKISG